MKHKKIAAVFLVILVSFALFAPYIAYGGTEPVMTDKERADQLAAQQQREAADPPNTACSLYRPWTWPACLAQGIVAIISFFIKLIITLAAWVLEVVFVLNRRIFETPAVKTGFSISLAVANLGFVLAIVVIAIMTILRSQTYGLKQTLWKLVVAALLVNFSLVIMQFIVGFSDQFTQYFIKASGGDKGISDFVLKFGQAFDPQKASGIGVASSTEYTAPQADGFVSVVVGGVLSVVILMIIAITMWTFTIMMFMRYIVLAFLAIIVPFAWLLWIFPDTKSNWTLWWSTFLRWTFFAPIVMFFIFLALVTYGSGSTFVHESIGDLTKNPNSASSAFVDEKSLGPLRRFFTGFTETIASQILIIGLVMGGMYAANKLGIKGADAAIKRMGAVNAAVSGYMGRRGRQAVTSAFRGKHAQQLADRLQQTGVGRGRLARALGTIIPVIPAARYLGRGMKAVGTAGGEKFVEEERARTKDMTIDQKIAALSTATAPQKIAWIEDIKNAGKLGDVQNIERYVGEGSEKEFKRYNKETLYKEARKESGVGLVESVTKKDSAKIEEHVKSMSDMSKIAGTIFVPQKKIEEREKEKKDLAPGIRYNEGPRLAEAQEALIRNVLEHGSATNISTLLKQIERGDQKDALRKVVDKIREKGEPTINSEIREWFNSSSARALGAQALFRLQQGGEPKIEIAEERGNVRSRTVFPNA